MIFIDSLKAFLFGFLQGSSEFLPISSSGHLVLLQFFLPAKSFDLLFVLVLHLGSLTAILTFYQKEIVFIIKSFHPFKIHRSNSKFIYLLFCGTLPSILCAFFLKPFIEKSLESLFLTGLGFMFTAFFLIGVFKIKKKNLLTESVEQQYYKCWKNFSFKEAFVIGLAQVLAFFPGVSRSGLTIATALFFKKSYKQAGFFSFMLAVPAILGSFLFEIFTIKNIFILNQANNTSNMGLSNLFSFYKSDIFSLSLTIQLILAFLSSWIFGYLAIQFLIKIIKPSYFPCFAFYLLPLSLISILIGIGF